MAFSHTNPQQDACRVFEVLINGGTAIIPTNVGYAFVGISEEAIDKTYRAKRRTPNKLHAFCGAPAVHDAVHVLDDAKREMVRAIWSDEGLTVGCVALADTSHPMIQNIPAGIRKQSMEEGTIALLLGAGPFLDALTMIGFENDLPIIGSSANLTGKGVKYRVSDIEREVLEAADMVLDYGLMRWEAYKFSSTMIDFRDLSVVRSGACFDLIQDLLRLRFGSELKPRGGSGTN